MPWRYRYLREYLPDEGLMGSLNALGEDGWSLLGPPVWVPPGPLPGGAPDPECLGVWRCFFKRTVSSREHLREVFALSPTETHGP